MCIQIIMEGHTLMNKYTEFSGLRGTIKYRETDIYIEFTDEDRLDNVSYRIYGDPQYWWLILQANGYAMEFDIEPGELIRVPYPLSGAIGDMNVG